MTPAIYDALKKRFCAPEWAMFHEVHRSTGGGTRSADAIAMNLFPSRGLRVHGVEVKASRGDWLRELRDPAKADLIMQFCDHWWIAAAKGVVHDGELPPTWGLLELSGGVLRQKVAAPKLDAKPMDRPFIASMFRRASERAAGELRAAVDAKLVAERAAMREQIDRAVKDRTGQYAALKAEVDAFEAASGIKLHAYSGGARLGATVKMLEQVGIGKVWGGIHYLAEQARKFADDVDKALPMMTTSDGDKE